MAKTILESACLFLVRLIAPVILRAARVIPPAR
jgi:hypothetical protein